MNTTKVGTQRVNTMSTQKGKNSFQNFYYLFAYLYAIAMMAVLLGCLYINDSNYCGFHKKDALGNVTTSFPAWSVFLIIMACISFCFAFSIFVLRRFRPVETKCTYLVRDCLITNIVLFYFVILACCAHDPWLWNWQNGSEHMSTGGINFLIWSLAFVLYLICSQINHYKGAQIKAWFRKNPFNK